MKVKSLSRVRLFATSWIVACQAPLSMGFSRQEYWSGFPFPSPGDLPDPAIKPGSLALQTDTLPSEPPWGFNHNQDLTKFCFQLFELIYPLFYELASKWWVLPNKWVFFIKMNWVPIPYSSHNNQLTVYYAPSYSAKASISNTSIHD